MFIDVCVLECESSVPDKSSIPAVAGFVNVDVNKRVGIRKLSGALKVRPLTLHFSGGSSILVRIASIVLVMPKGVRIKELFTH